MLAAQTRGAQLETVADVDLRPQLGERMDVWIESPPPDHVAPRGRHARPPEAREQRAGEQERRADLPRELGIQLVRGDLGCMDADLVLADPLDVGPERRDQRDHRLDVPNPRHVREHDRLTRQEARGEHRQGAVLVPGGAHPAAEGLPALDHEGLGERIGDGGLGHGEGLS